MSRLASDRTCFTRFGLRRQSTSKRNQILKRFLCVFLNVAFEVPTLRYRTCRDFSRSLIVIWQVISWQSIAANVKTLASRVVVQGGQGILQSCDRPGRGATSSGHFKRKGSWHMNSGSSPMQGLRAVATVHSFNCRSPSTVQSGVSCEGCVAPFVSMQSHLWDGLSKREPVNILIYHRRPSTPRPGTFAR